ncbi:MAG: hypothetical protein WA655_01560 [Candidatus Korobacteraceae bacterium]
MKRTMAAIALAALSMANFGFAHGKECGIFEAPAVNRQTSARYLESGSENGQFHRGPVNHQLVGDCNNDRGMIIGMYRPPGTLHNPTTQGELLLRNHNLAGDPGSNLNDGAAGDTSTPQLRAGDGPGVPSAPPCCRV